MDSLSYFLTSLLTFIIQVQGMPYGEPVTQQACGDRLADIMQLMCQDRGYNMAFRDSETSRRTRRGIVEDCCRRSCTQGMLELYCRPDSKEKAPPDTQIQKRSDDKTWSSEGEGNKVSNTNTENPLPINHKRHWHSKDHAHKHQTNTKSSDKSQSTEFKIGVQTPYYTNRKHSRRIH